MRFSAKTAILTGAFLMVATPAAFAGFDEASQYSFWTHQSVSAPVSAEARGRSRNEQYRATYADPASQAAAQAQKDPQYFYHAAGTMGSQ